MNTIEVRRQAYPDSTKYALYGFDCDNKEYAVVFASYGDLIVALEDLLRVAARLSHNKVYLYNA